MEILVDINSLKESELTPNEYILMKAIKSDNLKCIYWDYSKDYDSLVVKGYISHNDKVLTSTKKEINAFIAEWLELWPKHLLPGNYRISGNTIQVHKRMNTFLKNFKHFDQEIIMEATKKYLSKKEKENWVYTKKNVKFIYDEEGSTLEQECLALLSDADKNIKQNSVDL
jgi:hypothetical protein